MRSRPDAARVYLALSFFSHLFFGAFAAISQLYRIRTAGLDPLQLVLVGTVLEATIFVAETPTGVVADLSGRKRSIVIGTLLVGAGFTLEGLMPVFGAILAAQVVWGLGHTFTSGATEAWLVGELTPGRATDAFMRGAQASNAGLLAGTIGGGLAGALGLRVPLVAAGAGTIALGLWLARAMPETSFARAPDGGPGPVAVLRDGASAIRGRPVLLALVAVSLVVGLSSEGFDRLWHAHVLAEFEFPVLGALGDVFWFGALAAASTVLSIAGIEISRRRVDVDDDRVAARILIGLSAVRVAAGLGFAFAARLPAAVAALLVGGVARSASAPVYRAWLARRAPDRVRATVVSAAGQINALGEIAGGPPLGLLARAGSIRAGLAAAALLLTPNLVLYGRAGRARADAPLDRS